MFSVDHGNPTFGEIQ